MDVNQEVQAQLERTIGSLVTQNISLSAQLKAALAQIDELKATAEKKPA
jgi:phosphate uptake regulator